MTRIAIQVRMLCSAVAIIFAFQTSLAEENDRPYMDEIDSFFQKLADNKGDEGILALYESSPYSGAMADAINNVAFQLAGLDRVFGSYNSHEILIHKIVADRYAYLMYFVAYDRQPFKFEFHFYKPDDKWQFHKFSFSDEIESDIVEAAKIGLIREFPY